MKIANGSGPQAYFTSLLVDIASQISNVTIHKFIFFPLDWMEVKTISHFAEVTATYVVSGRFLFPPPTPNFPISSYKIVLNKRKKLF